jgi:hypothetical protein
VVTGGTLLLYLYSTHTGMMYMWQEVAPVALRVQCCVDAVFSYSGVQWVECSEVRMFGPITVVQWTSEVHCSARLLGGKNVVSWCNAMF